MNACSIDVLPLIVRALACFVELAMICGGTFAIHYFLTLPMRRTERGLFFIDIVETGLKQGKRVEETIVSASASGEHALGARFHLLAAWLEKGLTLADALAKVPRLLPAQIVAMLRAGQRIGDVGKVLPACRQLFQDAISQTRGAYNYMMVLAFALTPVTVAITTIIAIYILPHFEEVVMWTSESGGALSEHVLYIRFLAEHMWLWIAVQVCVLAVFLFAGFIYIGGPRVIGWARVLFDTLPDELAWQVPWKRKRMQRTFSAMLSVLLDSGVPEAEAVQLAADCTANAVLRTRAAKVVEAIRSGVKLAEAVEALDDTGEFRWRLTNATHARGGFWTHYVVGMKRSMQKHFSSSRRSLIL